MTEEDLKTLREYIDRAFIIGRSSSSDLADSVIKKMREELGKEVDIKINGKLIKLTSTVENHFNLVDSFMKEDKEWKTKNEPYLQALCNLSGAGRIIVWCAVGLSAIIGGWFAIKELFTK